MITKNRLLVLFFSLLVAAGNVGAAGNKNGLAEGGTAPLAPSIAGPIQIGGKWTEFLFGAANSFATTCLPAACVPSSGGNSVYGDLPPWTFTAPSIGATLTVTDAFLDGDEFEIFDFGVSIGTTSVVAIGGACGDDPVPCLADPLVSHGVFNLEPGAHEITIKATVSPFGGGAAYFRVDEAKLDHFVCYKVKSNKKSFKKIDVRVRNQFGTDNFTVLSPDTLCVPSTKEVIKDSHDDQEHK